MIIARATGLVLLCGCSFYGLCASKATRKAKHLLGRQTLAQNASICFENKWSVPCDVLEDAPQ
jgi:hypothetical protein